MPVPDRFDTVKTVLVVATGILPLVMLQVPLAAVRQVSVPPPVKEPLTVTFATAARFAFCTVMVAVAVQLRLP